MFLTLPTKILGFFALALLSLGARGLALASGAQTRHGTVEARGPVAKVVAVGPIALHAYSQDAGGSLYAAPAITGTDRDCQVPASATPVAADRVATFEVSEKQVACLKTATSGTFELLWHAVDLSVPVMVIAKANH